ncbi:protein app1-like [Teleopsis dalmanni]|uniref:protein app1-like n=1 Tax=Teleopsis dalmanni TaxID=139649 RepID=UPI0018CF0358|nr:protein app1-like [Teleopsis dalmanni]
MLLIETMTIPTRPAPAPPGSRAQNAVAGANASLEQLRLQLQQQNGSIQNFTVKLPPPPKGSTTNGVQHRNISNHSNNNSDTTTITRKFPQARYAPATSWDDKPFDHISNSNFKKVPPPRPPPPKAQPLGRKLNAPLPPAQQSTNILTNIFNRKKSTRAPTPTNTVARNYNSSSHTYGSTVSASSTSQYNSNNYSSNNWNSSWNTTTNTISSQSSSSLSTLTANINPQEAQLISFDSPPSSPTFTQKSNKSNSDCLSVDSFSSDSNFSSPQNGSVSQPESGFEDDFSATRSRPPTTSPLDPWETLDAFDADTTIYGNTATIGTAPVRNLNSINTRIQASNDNPLCNGKSLLPPTTSLTVPTIIKPKISQKPKAPKPPVLSKPIFGYNSVLDTDLSTPPSPPMPQCPPPALPQSNVSLLDVISGKADAIHLGTGAAYTEELPQPYGTALYDFDGVEEGDLSFRENEKIYLLEQVSTEWYRGRTRAGCEGIFPVNYIDIKVTLESVRTPTSQQESTRERSSTIGSQNIYKPIAVRCLYNFPAEVQGDLALKENDFVTILYKINEDWLHGEYGGRQGQFPSNFLEYVPDNIPMP